MVDPSPAGLEAAPGETRPTRRPHLRVGVPVQAGVGVVPGPDLLQPVEGVVPGAVRGRQQARRGELVAHAAEVTAKKMRENGLYYFFNDCLVCYISGRKILVVGLGLFFHLLHSF